MSLQESNISYVLYAEDDPDDSLIFEEAISKLNLEIKLAIVTDGVSVISHLQDKIPDIIFLDLNMPLKNGLECLHAIRNDVRLSHLPVIIYSTSSSVKDIEECFREGANFYVIKPFHFSDIIETLERIFGINWKLGVSKTPRQQFVLKV